jgi:hypothetical protein
MLDGGDGDVGGARTCHDAARTLAADMTVGKYGDHSPPR